MSNSVSVQSAKKRLATIWFLGAGIIFAIVFLQTLFGRYSGQIVEAWGWFMPAVVPTLSLMVGIFVFEARQGRRPDRQVDAFVFRLAIGLSLAYFTIILATLLLRPLTAFAPLELLNISDLWLGPLQGLATGALGAFFVKAERQD